MRRENRRSERDEKINKEIRKRKWLSIGGFTVSILLLSIAIYLSINEEKNQKLAHDNRSNLNTTIVTSREFGKTVNELELESESNNTKNNNIIISEKEEKNEENDMKNNATEKMDEENNKERNLNNDSQIRKVNANANEAKQEQNETDGNKDEENNKEQTQFIKPVEGEILKEFAMDSLTYSNTLQEWITHRGIDIKANRDTEVKSIADGSIKAIKNDPRYGTSIIISHNDGFESVYASLNSTEELKEGDLVKQGQVIGKVGNSAVFEVLDGTHLHFELLKDAEYVNPEIYIK